MTSGPVPRNPPRLACAGSLRAGQPARPQQSAGEVGQKIVPTGAAARQAQLMPLVERADQPRFAGHDDLHRPAAQSADQSAGGGERSEWGNVRKLVPRRRDQVDRDRLCATDQQGQGQPQHRGKRERARDGRTAGAGLT